MFGTILAFITGLAPTLNSISEGIFSLEKAKMQAVTDQQKNALQAQIMDLQAKRDVLVAEAGSRINTWVRAIAALGPISYLTKIFLWDKVVGSIAGCSLVNSEFCRTMFQTDPLDPYLWGVVTAVIGFYFLATWRR